jgi:hypothetical protein
MPSCARTDGSGVRRLCVEPTAPSVSNNYMEGPPRGRAFRGARYGANALKTHAVQVLGLAGARRPRRGGVSSDRELEGGARGSASGCSRRGRRPPAMPTHEAVGRPASVTPRVPPRGAARRCQVPRFCAGRVGWSCPPRDTMSFRASSRLYADVGNVLRRSNILAGPRPTLNMLMVARRPVVCAELASMSKHLHNSLKQPAYIVACFST